MVTKALGAFGLAVTGESAADVSDADPKPLHRALLLWVQDWVQSKKKSGVHCGRTLSPDGKTAVFLKWNSRGGSLPRLLTRNLLASVRVSTYL